VLGDLLDNEVPTIPRVAAAAAVRDKAAGILEKSHEVEKNWKKKFNLKQYFLIFTDK
jgi:hypothetical protein